jgi:hypothetical protein
MRDLSRFLTTIDVVGLACVVDRGERNFKPARIVDVISATVTESYSVAGCATAEQATLEYEVDDLTSSGPTGGAQSVTGRGICIGAERKEATVQSIESAAGALKARLRNWGSFNQ